MARREFLNWNWATVDHDRAKVPLSSVPSMSRLLHTLKTRGDPWWH